MKRRAIIGWALLVLVTGASGDELFKRDKRGEDPNIRSVQGAVTNAQEQVVEGAVVKLKNMKSLQVRSFITQGDGTYYFHGLSTNVDYELKADYKGASSETKTLSVFNTRKKAVINLKLESK
ncbi:MAG: carboxypeptidase-like regulatory domain-containing protein [Bryobacteraceae bacterium]